MAQFGLRDLQSQQNMVLFYINRHWGLHESSAASHRYVQGLLALEGAAEAV